jgi:hypothetical protein
MGVKRKLRLIELASLFLLSITDPMTKLARRASKASVVLRRLTDFDLGGDKNPGATGFLSTAFRVY